MARFHPGTPPRFLLTVDTEEEFDWNRPFTRAGHRVDTLPRLRKFQQFCEGLGVTPVYMLDYPVASSPMAVQVLAEPIAAGRAEVGIQLHPWVNPPFEEELSEYNSFSGNLPRDLEYRKLLALRDLIARNFGRAPLIYRAGRYGSGPNTAEVLRELGIAIDSSVRPLFDYGATGGPNHRDLPAHPWWVGATGSLLELPLTTVYAGALRRHGGAVYPRLWRTPRARSLLARTGLLERIPLTPEGVSIREALRAIDVALEDRLPLLVMSFHSPSLSPGHTPYVRSERDLDSFYDWWRAVLNHLRERGVQPTTIGEIMASAELG